MATRKKKISLEPVESFYGADFQLDKDQSTKTFKEVFNELEPRHTPSTGILIIAAGHPYYGRLAMNLITSIKVNFPNTKIALAYAGNGLQQIKKLFDLGKYIDHLIEVPAGLIPDERWINLKLHLPELSPFDNTLYLDADMLWLDKDPQKLFDQFSPCEFTCSNNKTMPVVDGVAQGNEKEFTWWFDVAEMIEKYRIKETTMANIRSEMMWFKKSEPVRQMFSMAAEISKNPLIKARKFAGGIPDEFALEIAIGITGMPMHKTPFLPIYSEMIDQKWLTIKDCISRGYFAYSVAGGNYIWHIKFEYDHLVKVNANKAAMRHNTIFLLKQKSDFLPERIKI